MKAKAKRKKKDKEPLNNQNLKNKKVMIIPSGSKGTVGGAPLVSPSPREVLAASP